MQLRLAAQKLADQLSQVEEMEAKIEGMLKGEQSGIMTTSMADSIRRQNQAQ